MRVLGNLKVWLPPVAVVAALSLVYFAYLAAVVSPEDNAEGLPIALVNEDEGAMLNGEEVDFGGRVVEEVTGADSPASDAVEWARPESREEALEGLGNNEYYGAIIVPEDYSQRLSDLSGPPKVPNGPEGMPPKKPPEPARIEVLTNPAAGPTPSNLFRGISSGVIEGISRATSGRITGALAERGARVSPEAAAVIGDPVRGDVVEAQPVGSHSGNGQSPFFLAFLANLSGIVGASVIFFGVGGAADALASRGRRPSHAGLWSARLVLGFVYAAVVAGAELGVAFGLLGVGHGASTARVFLFLALAVAVTAVVTMLLAAAFGPIGIGISAVLNALLGLVSSGGLLPLEVLPGFYRAYADWLPLRYVIDGLRSLLLYDGRPEAGLAVAVGVLGAYLAGGALLGYAFSLVQDRFLRRKKIPHDETDEQSVDLSGVAR